MPSDLSSKDSENEVTASKPKSSTPRALPSTSTKQNIVDKPVEETKTQAFLQFVDLR